MGTGYIRFALSYEQRQFLKQEAERLKTTVPRLIRLRVFGTEECRTGEKTTNKDATHICISESNK